MRFSWGPAPNNGAATAPPVGAGARWHERGDKNPDLDFNYDIARGNGWLLGMYDGRLVASATDQNLEMYAGARSGKSISVINNLLQYRGSVIVNDSKGELCAATAIHRAKVLGQKVGIIDPYHIVPDDLKDFRVRFDPMRRLRSENLYLIEDAGTVAGAFIVPSDDGNSRHWDESASAFFRTALLHVATFPSYESRTLDVVYDILMNGRDLGVLADGNHYHGMEGLRREMLANTICPAVIAGANTHFSRPDKEREGVMSTLRRQIDMLSYPAIRRTLSANGVALEALRQSPCTIYICLPVSRLYECKGLARCILMQTLPMCEAHPVPRGELPIWMVLDEIAALGKMEKILQSNAYLPGLGLRMINCWQSFSQPTEIYGREAGKLFQSNAGALCFFGIGGDEAAKRFLESRCGKTLYEQTTQSDVSPHGMISGTSGMSWSDRETPLLSADRAGIVTGRDSFRQIIVTPQGRPLLCDRVAYFNEPLKSLIKARRRR